MIQTTYTKARANLSTLLDEVTINQEIVMISRRGKDDVAVVAASELNSLLETAHLLRSPKNAKRLMDALEKAKSSDMNSQSVKSLRIEVGLDE
ncbi:MAG: type II toxin-antitoxin system prevent-host-death family antitoxin [Proteobacteria bacterium]|nr:type II toxin-antitoxin system prevent-host-death family antitoxin [Pseudomonadota bacterium]